MRPTALPWAAWPDHEPRGGGRMEYNISARNTDHLLKERINKAAESANALLAATVREACDEAALCAALREYVRVRYLLGPHDLEESDHLNYLGELSLARSFDMSVEEIRRTELDAKCENTSSSMTKKILLVIALNQVLQIDISPEATAELTTIGELCQEAWRQLQGRSE